jgi:hypothetical protein
MKTFVLKWNKNRIFKDSLSNVFKLLFHLCRLNVFVHVGGRFVVLFIFHKTQNSLVLARFNINFIKLCSKDPENRGEKFQNIKKKLRPLLSRSFIYQSL